jgi:tetratricopeptide (TPR) repeat protein
LQPTLDATRASGQKQVMATETRLGRFADVLQNLSRIALWFLFLLAATPLVTTLAYRKAFSERSVVLRCSALPEEATKLGYSCDSVAAELVQVYRFTIQEAAGHLDPKAKLTKIDDLGASGAISIGKTGISIASAWTALGEALGTIQVVHVMLEFEKTPKSWRFWLADPSSPTKPLHTEGWDSFHDAIENAGELLVQLVEPCRAVPYVAFRRGDAAVAIAVQQCLESETPEAEALTLTAQAFTTRNQHELAAVHLQRAKELTPADPYLHLQWIVHLYGSGKQTKAREQIDLVDRTKASISTKLAYENLDGLLSLDGSKDACVPFRNAEKQGRAVLHPADEQTDPILTPTEERAVRRRLAEVLTNLARYCPLNSADEKIGLLKDAIILVPGYAPAYNDLGNYYRALGQLDEAHRYYDLAVFWDANFGYAFLDRWLARCIADANTLNDSALLQEATKRGVPKEFLNNAERECRKRWDK